MEISTIGVLGAGTMGGGIALVAAQAGFKVLLKGTELSRVNNSINRLESFMNKSVQKGKLTEEQKQETLRRITPTNELSDFKEVDLVVEAIIENLELKKKAFSELDNVCKPETIITTNTSSMSINMLAGATKRPDRVAGMHFFNPPPIMKLVEVVRGHDTSDETVEVIFEVAKKMGKTTVEVKKDYPGFIVTRVNMAQIIEAIRLVEEGVATPEDIDTALKLGLNWPMGPFEMQDFIGLDVSNSIMEYFNDEFKEARWNPPQSLKALIRSGRLGKKSNSGWFNY
ncbi:MAG: 3-hydroxyacyl-CoA dehydrogenase family protein [Bacillota bacterium]|nr:3-hydroxyacyl-CoA dehydrogenase family protein [Bacillota bacterium]